MTDPVLKVDNLRKEFGGLVAVKDVSFTVGKGEFVGLIGPNGCGTVSYTHLTLPTILLV